MPRAVEIAKSQDGTVRVMRHANDALRIELRGKTYKLSGYFFQRTGGGNITLTVSEDEHKD